MVAFDGGPPPVERSIVATLSEPSAVKTLGTKIDALPQSLITSGTPGSNLSPSSFRTVIVAAVGATAVCKRRDADPAGTVRTTTMSLPDVAVGTTVVLRAGAQVAPVASWPYTGCAKFHRVVVGSASVLFIGNTPTMGCAQPGKPEPRRSRS